MHNFVNASDVCFRYGGQQLPPPRHQLVVLNPTPDPTWSLVHFQIAQMRDSTLKVRLHAFHISGEFLMLQQRSLVQPSSVLPSPCLTAIYAHVGAASFTLS